MGFFIPHRMRTFEAQSNYYNQSRDREINLMSLVQCLVTSAHPSVCLFDVVPCCAG